MTAIAERRLEHLLSGLPRERQAEILAALHAEVAHERKRRIECEALRAITAAVVAEAQLSAGAAEFLAQLARLIRADGATLVLLEPGGFRVVATRTFPEPTLPQSGTFVSGLTERLVRVRAPVPLPDASVVGRHGRAMPRSVAGWAIPLLVDGEFRGFVTIRRAHADPFTHEHLRLAQGAAAAAGPALILLQRFGASSAHAGQDQPPGRSPQRVRRLSQKSERRRQGGVLRRHDGPHS